MTTVLITGASSGIGRATATLLLEHGWDVVGIARRAEAVPDGVIPVVLDLADPEAITAAFARRPLAETQVDVVIHCAGYGHFAPVEFTPPSEAARQLQVNVISVASLLQKTLPGMRTVGGRVVLVSSIASQFSSPMAGWYHASKAALESMADSLRQEVGPQGIDIAIVQPGVVDTPWHATAVSDLTTVTTGTPYERIGAGTAEYHRRNATSSMVSSVEEAARVVVTAATTPRPRTRYRVGRGTRIATLLPCLLPDRVFDRLVARQFGA